MANVMYDSGREAFLDGLISWSADDIRCVLVDTDDYVVDVALHDNLDDVLAAARVAVSDPFTGKTTDAGVADADNVTFPSVSGDPSEAVVIYRHTGVESTSQLIAYIDSAGGLPVTPNGGDVNITWDDGVNRIFKL